MDSFESRVGTPAQPALASRLEALVQRSSEDDVDLPVGPVLAASLTGLRSEISGMRVELTAIRTDQSSRIARLEQLLGAAGGLDDPLEERLAAIEDTLDGLAERFEALARDSAMDAGERLASLDERLATLTQSVGLERGEAAAHRERLTGTLDEQSAALDEWVEAVRHGLEDLGEAVTNSLASLGGSLSSSSNRESDRRHLEALVTELTTTVDEAFRAIGDQIEASQDPLHTRLDQLHESVLNGFGGARSRLVEELAATIARLEEANTATRGTVEAELAELRGDLADALDEIREGVDGTVTGANESITRALEEHRAASEELRSGIRSAATSSQEGRKQVRDLQEAVDRLDQTLSDLQADWRPRVDAVVAEGRAAAQGVLEQVHAEMDQALGEMRDALSGQVGAVRSVSGTLSGGADRLVSAGQALLAYLAERDRWLERERDRVLHELLDEFASGLSAKERRAVSSRVGEALDRRRDARDAQRWRRTEDGKPALEIPEIPAELTTLADPLPERPATALRPRSAPTPTRASTAPRKTTAKKAPASKTVASKTSASRTPAKKAAAKKAASPATQKSASPAKAAPRSRSSS